MKLTTFLENIADAINDGGALGIATVTCVTSLVVACVFAIITIFAAYPLIMIPTMLGTCVAWLVYVGIRGM